MANIKKLPLFVRCVIQNFPFIEEDFDALTNYELISKVVEFLNKVISSQNEVIGVANDLSAEFQQLHDYVEHYFDNLDVQEEINNKLDAMADAGTLQEIIGEYLNANAVWGFNTVADMTTSTNLVDGSYARTLGYREKGDGGGSLYKIRTITNDDVVDGGGIIAMQTDSNLVAELIPEKQVVPEQFGAYGDGTHDDILACRACHDYARSKKIEMGGVRKSVYGLSESLTLLLNGYDFNNATFKALAPMTQVILYHPFRDVDEPVPNEYLKNIRVECAGKANYGIHQDQGGAISFVNNVSILNPLMIGFYQSYGSVRLQQLKVEQQDLTQHCVGYQTDGVDSELSYITCKNCSTGILINGQGNTLTSCHPSMFDAPALLKESKGFHLKQNCAMVNCVSDTYNYGIYLETANGFTSINFHNIVEPNYYNTTSVADANPYFLYSSNTSVGRTNGISMFGSWMNESTVYDSDYVRFTNFTTWKGTSIKLNNPKLNLARFNSYMPKELYLNDTYVDIKNNKTSAVTGIDAGNIIVNGNTLTLYLTNLTLDAIAINTDTTIFSSIDSSVTLNVNNYFTATTMAGVVCRCLFKNDGSIIIKPQSAITAGDKLWINQAFVNRQ